MTPEIWVILGIWLVGQMTAIVVVYINVRIKLKEIEVKLEVAQKEIETNLHAFHIHERQNEKSFDKFEKKIDGVYTVINEVKKILMERS